MLRLSQKLTRNSLPSGSDSPWAEGAAEGRLRVYTRAPRLTMGECQVILDSIPTRGYYSIPPSLKLKRLVYNLRLIMKGLVAR